MNGSHRCSGFMVLAAVILAMVLYNGLPGGPAAAAADVNTLIFQGSDFHYRGDIEKAIQRFEKALQLDPDNEFAHNQLGLLYAKKGNYRSAAVRFSAALQIDRENTFAMLWLGILSLQNGETQRGPELVEEDPGHSSIKQGC